MPRLPRGQPRAGAVLRARIQAGDVPQSGPDEPNISAALSQRGYRFSIDHVSDLRIEPRELADRGVRFIKVPATLLLDPETGLDLGHPSSDLSDLLGRFGIDLIAERIEGERAVVDLLDFDVRFGQGFLLRRPGRCGPKGPSATGGATPNKAQESNGSMHPHSIPARARAGAGDRQCRAGAPRRRSGLTRPAMTHSFRRKLRDLVDGVGGDPLRHLGRGA
jgi:cyclic-di-GMP phosphodiesterase TipF (flagellum assembly factor)